MENWKRREASKPCVPTQERGNDALLLLLLLLLLVLLLALLLDRRIRRLSSVEYEYRLMPEYEYELMLERRSSRLSGNLPKHR